MLKVRTLTQSLYLISNEICWSRANSTKTQSVKLKILNTALWFLFSKMNFSV